jgi:hypothetical protein
VLKETLQAAGSLPELAYIHARARKRVAALEMLTEIQKRTGRHDPNPYQTALIYAASGGDGSSISLLEEAYRKRDRFMTHLKVDPRLDDVRSDPRFQDLLRRVGLPQ